MVDAEAAAGERGAAEAVQGGQPACRSDRCSGNRTETRTISAPQQVKKVSFRILFYNVFMCLKEGNRFTLICYFYLFSLALASSKSEAGKVSA